MSLLMASIFSVKKDVKLGTESENGEEIGEDVEVHKEDTKRL